MDENTKLNSDQEKLCFKNVFPTKCHLEFPLTGSVGKKKMQYVHIIS